jgi:hypothetical protein
MKILMLLFTSVFSNPAASQYVNDMEPLLQANRDNYLSGPHTIASQQAALAFFDQHWTALRSSSGCGAGVLKDAGRKCIVDRSRTGQWPWEVYYRDPIIYGRL